MGYREHLDASSGVPKPPMSVRAPAPPVEAPAARAPGIDISDMAHGIVEVARVVTVPLCDFSE